MDAVTRRKDTRADVMGKTSNGLSSLLKKAARSVVMPGLDPGIHVLVRRKKESRGWPGQARP
jgi:hypothetical protein